MAKSASRVGAANPDDVKRRASVIHFLIQLGGQGTVPQITQKNNGGHLYGAVEYLLAQGYLTRKLDGHTWVYGVTELGKKRYGG